MDIVKNNIVSIICGVVALLAVIVYFWPVGSLYRGLEAQVQERQRAHASLTSLQTKQRRLPIVDPDNPQAEQLDRFPSNTVIEIGRRATQQVEQESRRLRDAAINLNRRDPLGPNVFPQPRGGGALRFRDDYGRHMTETIPSILRAGMPPTQERLNREMAALEERMRLNVIVAPDGRPMHQEMHERNLAARRAALPKQLMTEVSQQSMIYMLPDALAFHPAFAFEPGRAPTGAAAPEDMWYAQVGLWIQHDIAVAIATANQGANNVLDAPIKRLVRIDLGSGQQGRTGGGRFDGGGRSGMGNNLYLFPPIRTDGRSGRGGDDYDYEEMARRWAAPVAPEEPDPAAADAPVRLDYTVSPTGRVSNNMYDVVPFRLTLVVEADKIPLVLQRLTADRLLYVRTVEQIDAVDSALEQGTGFLYGEHPVVLVVLDCEALFLRAWTLDLMPRNVRTQLQAATRDQAM